MSKAETLYQAIVEEWSWEELAKALDAAALKPIDYMDYTIIEIKGNIPLAYVRLNNGKLRFMNKFKIPADVRAEHYATRNTEVLNPQTNY